MRTIKFRAWDKVDNRIRSQGDVDGIKEWPSLLAVGFHGLPICIDEDSFKGDKIIGWNRDHNLILMQFTGLTDKNGIEIYEGDIVRINGLVFEITTNDFTQEWVIDGETGQERLGLAYKKVKVIGNIYEYPELLGASE